MNELITAAMLKELAAAGTVREVILIPVGAGFAAKAKVGMIERVVRPAHGSQRPRIFKTIDAGAKFARELGIARITVEIANWDPSQKAA
jgi:hypothetical protein